MRGDEIAPGVPRHAHTCLSWQASTHLTSANVTRRGTTPAQRTCKYRSSPGAGRGPWRRSPAGPTAMPFVSSASRGMPSIAIGKIGMLARLLARPPHNQRRVWRRRWDSLSPLLLVPDLVPTTTAVSRILLSSSSVLLWARRAWCSQRAYCVQKAFATCMEL